MKKYLKQILSLLATEKSKLFRLIVLFLAGALLDLLGIGLVVPYFAIIFNETLPANVVEIVSIIGLPHDRDRLIIIVGMILLFVFLLKAIFGIFINYKIINFSQAQQKHLRSILMSSYQALPFSEYINRNSSEYIHSIQSLVVQYTDNVLMPSLRTVSDLIVATVIIGFLAFSNVYALLLLVFLLTIMLLGYDKLFRKKIHIYGKKANEAATLMVQGIHEGIEGLSEIRVLGKESYFHSKVQEQAVKFADYQAKTRVIVTSSRFLLELVLISFIVFLVFLMIGVGEDLQTLMPTLALFGVASIRLLPSATALSSNLIQIRFGRNAVDLLNKDLEYINFLDIKTTTSDNALFINDFTSLNVNNISFKYDCAKSIAIKNISMSLKRGEAIGIIGTSGSGKTTLINLLLGLLDPDSGEIFFDGLSLQENKELWQRQVAYIPQQILLIDDTLKKNIAFGINEKDIDDEKVTDSIDKASLLNVIKGLPDGVETILGERGVKLSGGQRQRIALARAFYHDRNILIMDESTSALDNETEKEIIREIKKLHGKKTMIVIAHRHSTVAHCDRIYKIEKGMVVEVNTPDKILNQ